MEENSVLSLLELMFTLDTDVPSLHTMLLPKLLSIDFENALSTAMVFHTVTLLMKELTSQQEEVGQ